MSEQFYYGTKPDGSRNTIHASTHFDVETKDGKVVAIWFRCLLVPFEQHEIDEDRARDLTDAFPLNITVLGLEVQRDD
jgi:hypothetical protein